MIPFVDLKAQYASIKNEVNAAIQGVLDSCQFTLGSEVAAFEEEFAAYSQAKHGIGVNTGTSALHLALLAARQIQGLFRMHQRQIVSFRPHRKSHHKGQRGKPRSRFVKRLGRCDQLVQWLKPNPDYSA